MKRAILWVLLGAAIVFFGSACGGGGGSTTSSTDSGTDSGGLLSNVQLVGVLNGTSSGVGLTNLAVGDTVQLEFIGTDSTGHQVVRAGSGFSTNAPSNVATVSSGGLLTVTGASSTTFSVSGTGPTGLLARNLVAGTAQAFVTGHIRNINSTGVANVAVTFYLPNGTLKATAMSGPNGTFRANVPPDVTGFTINIEQADPPGDSSFYYRQFAYGTKFFLDSSDCPVTLPTLQNGVSTPLPTDIVLADRASGPPPPPTGCLGG